MCRACRGPGKSPVNAATARAARLKGRLGMCRRVIILVKAGAPVDQTIDQLCEFMEPGDIIIDGGNEW